MRSGGAGEQGRCRYGCERTRTWVDWGGGGADRQQTKVGEYERRWREMRLRIVRARAPFAPRYYILSRAAFCEAPDHCFFAASEGSIPPNVLGERPHGARPPGEVWSEVGAGCGAGMPRYTPHSRIDMLQHTEQAHEASSTPGLGLD